MFVSRERKKKEEKETSNVDDDGSSWRNTKKTREKKGEGWREKSYFAAPLLVFI